MMAAAAAVAGGSPAAPSASSEPPTPASAKPANPMDKVECRREEETGSRLGAKKICMTRQEWANAARDARTMTEDVQTRGSAAKTPGS